MQGVRWSRNHWPLNQEKNLRPAVLAAIAQAAEEAGAWLIDDEIITGYRYPSGSVQRATGVIPDLTCYLANDRLHGCDRLQGHAILQALDPPC